MKTAAVQIARLLFCTNLCTSAENCGILTFMRRIPMLILTLLLFAIDHFQTERQCFRKGQTFQKAFQIHPVNLRAVIRKEGSQLLSVLEPCFNFLKHHLVGRGFQQMKRILKGEAICHKPCDAFIVQPVN